MANANNEYLRRRKVAIFETFGGCCGYCGRELSLNYDDESRLATLDHHVPRCHGGRGLVSNLWLACLDCNRRKRDMLPSEWYRENPTFNRVHPGVTKVTAVDRVYSMRYS